MARLLGVDIPNRKKVGHSLRYIYGVGPTRAKEILDADLKEAAEKKDKALKKTQKTNTLKDDLKVGITYRADQLKSLGKFALQKGKNKIYGQIDLLKTKID